MAYQRYFTVCAALALLYFALPHRRAFPTDFQEMLYPLQLVSEGAASPEDAAMSHFRACMTRSPELFSQNLLLGVCDGPIGTINAYAECLHGTTFSNGLDALTVYDLPFRHLQEETVRAVESQAFDTEDEEVASLLRFSGVSTYYGEEFLCVEVSADDSDGVGYRSRIVVARVDERWYAMPRCRSSRDFYQIADAMPLTVALTAAATIPDLQPVVLTPDTMAEYEFFIECRFRKVSEQNLADGRSAEQGVLVRFDQAWGPAINEFLSQWIANSRLVLRDSDEVLLSVPVQIEPWAGNAGGLAIDFTIQERLLEGAELIIESNTDTFIVDVSSFCERDAE